MGGLIKQAWRQARRAVVFVAGSSVLIAGAILIVVPGPPGWPLIPLGLGMLAIEFVWARRHLSAMKEGAVSLAKRLSNEPPTEREESREPKTCQSQT